MNSIDLRLSVEEVAFTLSAVNQPGMAHDLMIAQLGDMQQEEARVRLLAAGHSLMARGWLSMDEQERIHLADPLARVGPVLSHADFSIRYTRSHQSVDLTLSFHFAEGDIFTHTMEQGVVHHITKVPSTAAVIQGSLAFFEVNQTSPFACPSAEIPYALLEKIKDEEDTSSILRYLQESNVPPETQALLTEDLHEARYRGSILRVEYGEDNVPRSDHGLLVLRGPDRLWLLRPRLEEGEALVTILPGTEEVFRREVTALL